MASKKFDTDIEVSGLVLPTGVKDPAGGSSTQYWRTDGSKGSGVDSVARQRISNLTRASLYYTHVFGYAKGIANDFSDITTKLTALSSTQSLFLIRTVNGNTHIAAKNTPIFDFRGVWLTLATYYLDPANQHWELNTDRLWQAQLGSTSTVAGTSSEWTIYTNYNSYQVGDFTTWPDTGGSLFKMVSLFRAQEQAAATVNLDKYVRVDASQTFIIAEKTQGRNNIDAAKKPQIREAGFNIGLTQFLEWEGDTVLAYTQRRPWVMPKAGDLPDGWQILVKTKALGSIDFSTEDVSVSIEYNEVGAIGYMSERSEVWIILKSNIYYINGEVA